MNPGKASQERFVLKLNPTVLQIDRFWQVRLNNLEMTLKIVSIRLQVFLVLLGKVLNEVSVGDQFFAMRTGTTDVSMRTNLSMICQIFRAKFCFATVEVASAFWKDDFIDDVRIVWPNIDDFDLVADALFVFLPEMLCEGFFKDANVSALQNLVAWKVDRTDGTGERQLIDATVGKADRGAIFFRVVHCSKKVDPDSP